MDEQNEVLFKRCGYCQVYGMSRCVDSRFRGNDGENAGRLDSFHVGHVAGGKDEEKVEEIMNDKL